MTSNLKKRRSLDHSMEVHFSLVVKEALNLSSSEDSVEEKSEAVLFQMQYAVAAGQFMISLHGQNITADRSSLKHISSSVTCGAGFESTSNGKECVACPVGSFRDEKSLTCNTCEKGSYQDEEGQAVCKLCTTGRTTGRTGADSSDDCYKGESTGQIESEDNTFTYYIIASAVAAIVLLAVIAGYCRLRHCFCFALPNSTSKTRSYWPDNKVAGSHANDAYDEFPLDERFKHVYSKPIKGKENDPIYSEIPANTYASPYATGSQNPDDHYVGLHYTPNSVSYYENVTANSEA